MSSQIQADAAALKAEVRGQLWKDNLRDYGPVSYTHLRAHET